MNEAAALTRLDVASATPRVRGWLMALLYVGLSAAAVYPVFAVEMPALVDYANHLARIHVLANLDQSPLLAERYQANWGLVPNLAMDALLTPFARLFSVFDVGRVFLAVTLLLNIGGVLVLHRVLHGRIGLWPVALYLFLYNYVLSWGFLNYLFAAGLFMFALAGWFASREWRPWRRIALFGAVSVVLYFAHVFAFGVYGLAVMSHELGRHLPRRGWRWREAVRDWTVAGAQFVLPAALWLMGPTGAGGGVNVYGGLKEKIHALASPTMFYGELLDAEISVFVVVVLIGLLLLRRLRLAPEMRLPLIALGLAAVLMPNWLLSTWGADFRLPPLLAMLAVAATRPELKSSRVATILVTLAVVLFGARVVTVTDSWRAFDRDAAELRAAASRIDEGARILVVRERKRADPDDRQIVRRLYWYLAALTVIDRAAFLPFLFTDPEKQPLIVAPAYREIDTPYGHPIWLADLREGADPLRADRILGTSDNRGRYRYWAYWPYKFDYVLFLHFAPQDNPLPERLAPVSRGSFFDIYRVVRPGN